MSHLPFLLFAIILTYIATTLATYIRSAIRLRKLSKLSKGDLIQKLHPVPQREIRELALSHLDKAERPTYDSLTVWHMLGKARGVSHMIDNAEIMIALASYMELWNPTEGQFEAARMRMDAALLRRAAARLGKSVIAANSIEVALYAHEAASTYYRMTERLRTAMSTNPQHAAAL